MRKRAQAQASIDSLLQTICRQSPDARRPSLVGLPPASLSARVEVASVENIAHASSDKFVSCWIELRGDMLTFVESEPKFDGKGGGNTKVHQLSFCSKVDPPPSSICSNVDIRALAGKLLAKNYLAVYTSEGKAVWIDLDTKELPKWQEAIKSAINKRDGSAMWASKQAAYERLMPLVWKQTLMQAERFYNFISVMSDFMETTMVNPRVGESLNGWLQLRVTNPLDFHVDDSSLAGNGLWQECFCALTEDLFVIYPQAYAHVTVPDEIVALPFATVTANGTSSHAFSITTPIRGLELRAPDDATVDKWTDAIFAIQCTDSFNAAVPQAMRKEHFFSRLRRGKSGEAAVRLLKRASGPRKNSGNYDTMTAFEDMTPTPSGGFPGDIELSEVLRDPKLGALLRTFAEENNSAADLQLYMNVNEMVGTEVDVLDPSQVELLPASGKKQLLRLSKTCLSEDGGTPEDRGIVDSATSGDESGVMKEAYDRASRKLIGELLPRFCETDAFQKWLSQQQQDEASELQLLAMMQSPTGFKKLRAVLSSRPEEQLLMAAAQIRDLVLTSSAAVPCHEFASEIVKNHFSGAKAIQITDKAALDNLLAAVKAWGDDPKDENKRLVALSAFQHVEISDLHAKLQPHVADMQKKDDFMLVLAELREEQERATNLQHWMHLPASLDVMRKWMADQKAAENIDFVVDVIKFKHLDDVSVTKDNAKRIVSKYVSDGAVAQVCLPNTILNHLQEGIQPRFPSVNLFDDAVEHVSAFMQQEMWGTFKASSEYESYAPSVRSALQFEKMVTPVLLSVRGIGHLARHSVHLTKRIITIGTSNCDILTKEFGASGQTTVLQINIAPEKYGAYVSVLWNAATHRLGRSLSGMSSNSSTTSSIFERSRHAVLAQHKPRFVKFGETFLAGDLEAMLFEKR